MTYVPVKREGLAYILIIMFTLFNYYCVKVACSRKILPLSTALMAP